MYGMILVAALTLNDLPFDVLESFYWDCDTMFMKGELGGDEMFTCLTITDAFQKHFFDKFVFSQYWNAQKKRQWAQRGYYIDDEHED